jgi:hypothetical protein
MFDSTVRDRFNTQDKYMVKVPWAGVSEFGGTDPDRPSPSGGIKSGRAILRVRVQIPCGGEGKNFRFIDGKG